MYGERPAGAEEPYTLSCRRWDHNGGIQTRRILKDFFLRNDLTAVLGSCRAGMAWKTAKSRKCKKMEIEMENGPKLDRGKNGQKWKNNGKVMEFSIIFHFFAFFFASFAPVQLGAVFHFDFHFFSISGFWLFSMPYQPGRIPTVVSKIITPDVFFFPN